MIRIKREIDRTSIIETMISLKDVTNKFPIETARWEWEVQMRKSVPTEKNEPVNFFFFQNVSWLNSLNIREEMRQSNDPIEMVIQGKTAGLYR